MANVDIRGARRTGSSATNDVMAPLESNEFDELLVAQGLPPYAELVRLNAGWATMSTSAVAGLVVRPTTTAAFDAVTCAQPLKPSTTLVDTRLNQNSRSMINDLPPAA